MKYEAYELSIKKLYLNGRREYAQRSDDVEDMLADAFVTSVESR